MFRICSVLEKNGRNSQIWFTQVMIKGLKKFNSQLRLVLVLAGILRDLSFTSSISLSVAFFLPFFLFSFYSSQFDAATVISSSPPPPCPAALDIREQIFETLKIILSQNI